MFTLPEGITSTAPEYEPLPPGPVRPSIVSLFGPDGTGIRLRQTPRGLGYGLAAGATGLGPAPVENTTAPLGSGGVVLRHQRITESTVVLPIKIHAQSGRELRRMIAQLTKILTPGEGFATIAVYSPYSNESRYARVLYDSGLDEPQWDGPLSEKFTVVLERIDPYWVGEIRGEDYEVQPSIKPYITKYEGEPDPDGPPAVTYSWEGEPHASPSVKRVGGEIVARNLVAGGSFELPGAPGWRGNGASLMMTTSYRDQMWDSQEGVPEGGRWGERILQIRGNNSSRSDFYALQEASDYIPISEGEWIGVAGLIANESNSASESDIVVQFLNEDNGTISSRSDYRSARFYYGRKVLKAEQAPEGTVRARLVIWGRRTDDISTEGDRVWADGIRAAVAATESEALAQVEEYFDGDTPDKLHRKGAYEFPFIPMFLSDSTIQGELDINIEGDAPTYPTFTIRGPGEDPQFFFDGGKELFIPGVVDSNITIVTEPQFQDVYDESGPLWERIPKTRAAMEPLRPGRNTIKFSMVGASVQSLIRIEYREQWRGAH